MVHPRIPEADDGGDTYTTAPGPTSGQDHTSATPTNSGEGYDSNATPLLPPPRSKDTNPVYTEAVTVSGSKTTAPPPATMGVVYDDIKAYQNQDVQYIKRKFWTCSRHSFSFLGSTVCHTA